MATQRRGSVDQQPEHRIGINRSHPAIHNFHWQQATDRRQQKEMNKQMILDAQLGWEDRSEPMRNQPAKQPERIACSRSRLLASQS